MKKTTERTTEKQIEEHLRDRIKKRGGIAPKLTTPGTSGIPDRLVIIGGSIYLVELKKPTGRLSPVQKTLHQKIRSTGNPVYILWSYEDVDDFVDHIDDKNYIKKFDTP